MDKCGFCERGPHKGLYVQCYKNMCYVFHSIVEKKENCMKAEAYCKTRGYSSMLPYWIFNYTGQCVFACVDYVD